MPLLLRAVRYVLGVMTWLLIGSVLWIAGSAVARRGVRLILGFKVPIRHCSRYREFPTESLRVHCGMLSCAPSC